MAGERRAGTVRKFEGGKYEVELDTGEVVESVLRGRLKLEQRTGDRVVTGDRVEVLWHPDGRATIEAVADRHTELARRAPGRGARRAKIIVANVDQILIVFATAQPEPRLRMLDRFLVLAEANRLTPVVVINKIDLVGADAARASFAAYETAGYDVLYTSVPERAGIDALGAQLCGRTSVLTGPSGAGKSSLLNAIEPGLRLTTAEISEAAQKGQHTTVTARLIPLRCGGYVADTPGLRELGLWDVAAKELDRYFPEFLAYLDQCRFAGSCSHIHEPDCAVRAALERGEISGARYDSYRALRAGDETSV